MSTFVSEMTRRHSLDGGVTQTDPLGVTQTDPHGVSHTVLAVVEEWIWWMWKRGNVVCYSFGCLVLTTNRTN